MDFSRFGFSTTAARRAASTASKTIPAVLMLMAGTSTMYANLLSATPATVTLTCNTATGPGTNATIVIKPSPTLSSGSIVVAMGTLPAGVTAITTPASQTLTTSNQAAGLTYVINYAAGCVGASAGTAAPTVRFTAGGVNDVTVTVNTTVTATASALVASPSAVTVTCVKNGGVYTPGPAKTVSVTGAASGTPFTVDTATNPVASWLTVTPTTGGTVTAATASTFTVQPAAGCGGYLTGTSNSTTVHLLNAPAPDRNIVVTMQVLTPTPLTAAPSAPRLSYVKGSGAAGYADVTIASSASPAPFFSVDTTSLPIWLTVDATSAKTTKILRFSSTTVADSMAPGTYSATVNLKVSGSGDLAIPMTMLITNPAGRLTVAEGTARTINWTVGTAAPTPTITAVSSGSPISYTTTTGGTLAPSLSQSSGLAYSFGTQIGVTFDPAVLASAQPGTTLTGTVTFTWGTPVSTTVVTFSILVLSPGATVTAISPASIPTANAGQSFTVVLTGSGFVPSPDLTQKTRVGVVIGGVIVSDSNITWNIVNASNIILTINVPAVADTNLPFSPSGAGGTVNLGICNPAGPACTVPTGTAVLTIGKGPIVQVVTSASSFVQVNPGATPVVAPYDIISIFGTNFCTSNGTGCSSSQILYGTPDGALQYPAALSPDAVSGTQRLLSVKFQTHSGTPVAIANANLLFATNNQINLMVPSGTASHLTETVDIVVSFGYGTGTTMLSSTPFPVTIAATNPGIFTVGSDGQGQGAALDSTDYSLVGAGNEAGMRSTAADSDTILLYVTGLGAPDGTADNASSGSSAWSADCITPASYVTSLNAETGGSLTTADGLIIQTSLLNTGRLSPCVLSTSGNVPTVTIGGVAGTVGYAGWVAGSIAGLYQINVKLPGSAAGPFTDANGATVSTITAPVQLPVFISANSITSQTGVTIWVAPRLKVAAPSAVDGTVGVAWPTSNNAVVATEGTSPYHYAVTSGVLPSGLAINATTGAITGVPAANTSGTYKVTVTATDSAHVPVKDSVAFTLSVAGGLYVVSSGTSPFNSTFGTTVATVTTVAASGGIYPYTYAITSPASLPTGMTINANTGVVGITALTPAGTYHVTVTSTDSTSGTPLTGSTAFDIVVALNVTNSAPVAGTAGAASTITTVSSTGKTGTVAYTLDTTSAALAWLHLDGSTGILTVTTGSVAGSRSITVTATDGTAAPGAASAGVGTVTFTMVIN